MTIEESVVRKLRGLPPERQLEVLNFVEFLETKALSQDRVSSEKSALELGEGLVGRLDGGPGDLACDRGHLEDYGLAKLIEENEEDGDEILGFSEAKAFYGGLERRPEKAD